MWFKVYEWMERKIESHQGTNMVMVVERKCPFNHTALHKTILQPRGAAMAGRQMGTALLHQREPLLSRSVPTLTFSESSSGSLIIKLTVKVGICVL